jgi:hypothetical protein
MPSEIGWRTSLQRWRQEPVFPTVAKLLLEFSIEDFAALHAAASKGVVWE